MNADKLAEIADTLFSLAEDARLELFQDIRSSLDTPGVGPKELASLANEIKARAKDIAKVQKHAHALWEMASPGER